MRSGWCTTAHRVSHTHTHTESNDRMDVLNKPFNGPVGVRAGMSHSSDSYYYQMSFQAAAAAAASPAPPPPLPLPPTSAEENTHSKGGGRMEARV